jgi:hypothetical protein
LDLERPHDAGRSRRRRRLAFEVALGVIAVAAVVVFVMNRDRPPDLGSNAALAEELLDMSQADIQARNAQIDVGLPPVGEELSDEQLSAAKEVTRVDSRNTKRLKEIVDRYGWPGKTLVGEQGASAAWLIVQHAVHDRPFQKRSLKLMSESEPGEVDDKDVAFLTDRDRVLDKRDQVYGTQFHCVNGSHEPYPIEDLENVDDRRDRVGLDSLDDEQERQIEAYGDCPD